MSLKIYSGFFLFRHHTYKKVDGQVELSEVGPRFEMKGMFNIRVVTVLFVVSGLKTILNLESDKLYNKSC